MNKKWLIALIVVLCIGCNEPVSKPIQSSKVISRGLDMNYIYSRSHSEILPTDSSYLYDYKISRFPPIRTYNETFPAYQVEQNRLDIEAMRR